MKLSFPIEFQNEGINENWQRWYIERVDSEKIIVCFDFKYLPKLKKVYTLNKIEIYEN